MHERSLRHPDLLDGYQLPGGLLRQGELRRIARCLPTGLPLAISAYRSHRHKTIDDGD
jgi:hypothetical protein